MKNKYLLFLLVLEVLGLVISGFMARDFFTWCLEVAPAVVGTLVLLFTYNKFRFSNFVYTLILIHTFILMYGGIYTYAETPLGYWMKDIFGFTRNNYDKIGHFMQGFVPALIAREIFVRLGVVLKNWLPYVVVAFALSVSVIYEFFEWWASVLAGSKGDAFLGTQGYVWDTQSDMWWCLVGAVVALFLLSKYHDRQIEKNGY